MINTKILLDCEIQSLATVSSKCLEQNMGLASVQDYKQTKFV